MSYEHFCRYFDTFKFKIVQRYYTKYSININTIFVNRTARF